MGDSDEDAEDVGGLMGQQEHRPGKAKHDKNQTLIKLAKKKNVIWFSLCTYTSFENHESINENTLLMSSHNSIGRERQYILIRIF